MSICSGKRWLGCVVLGIGCCLSILGFPLDYDTPLSPQTLSRTRSHNDNILHRNLIDDVCMNCTVSTHPQSPVSKSGRGAERHFDQASSQGKPGTRNRLSLP